MYVHTCRHRARRRTCILYKRRDKLMLHVRLWVTVARDLACLKAELQPPLFSSTPTTAATARLISTPVHQGPLRAGRLRISTSALQGPQTAHIYSSQQGPLRAGRLRISTSAFQGPLRAADYASLLQPSKAERRRRHIYPKEGMCKIFCCWELHV